MLWTKKIYNILWAYQTIPWASIREMPFKLAFGAKAIIPVKIGLPSTRVKFYNEQDNLDLMRIELNLLEEIRE